MIQNNGDHKYDDIIHLPHHVSNVHPPMSLQNRAAQFSPFAALTGYEDQIREAARPTDTKMELSENMKELLDEKLQFIQEQLETKTRAARPHISVTYFQQDSQKEGGKYVTFSGTVKKIDLCKREIIFCAADNGSDAKKRQSDIRIAIDDVTDLIGSCEADSITGFE